MYLNFQHLVDSFEQRGEKVYSRMYDGERYLTISYRKFYNNIKTIATGLQQDYHLNKGDKVAIMSENRPEWMTMYFGVVYNGIVAVPFDAMLGTDEVKNLIKSSRVEIMGVSVSMYEKLKQDAEIMSLIKQWIVFDKNATLATESNVTFFADICQKSYSTPLIKHDLQKNDLASLIYTSGTTGAPKAVMLSNGNFMHQANSLWQAAHLEEEDTVLSVLPLHHTFQFSVELAMFAVGATITYADSIKPNRLVDCIKTTGVTIMVGIPTLYAKILDGIHRNINSLKPPVRQIIQGLLKASTTAHKVRGDHEVGKKLFKFLRKKAGLDSLKFLISGAAPLAPHVAEGYAALGFNLANGYGLTESSPVISVGNPVGYVDNRSVGNAIPKVQWKIMEAGPDGVGEICVKGDNVMQGYYENPEATAAVLMADGWLKTGDMGYIASKKGKEFLYITGRYKNIIVTGGGKNVYPEEIEDMINAHPYILESVVIGVTVSDSDMSEVPCALVVMDVAKLEAEGKDPHDAELRKEISLFLRTVNGRLQSYQKIRGYEILFDELHKNSTRKIKRFEYKGSQYRHLLTEHFN